MAYTPGKMILRKEFVWNDSFWTPDGLGADLALWLDADDASTITLNGSNVSQWGDKSGNGRDVVQGIATSQPSYIATGLNGKPTLSFDGFNDNLKNAVYEPAGAVNVSIVFNRTSTTGTIINVQRSGGIFEITGQFTKDYRNITLTGEGGTPSSSGFDDTNPIGANRILNVQYDGSGNTPSDFSASLDGIVQTIVTSDALGYLEETGFSVGGRPFQNLESGYYTGLISEIVFLNSTMTTADRQKLEGYLAWKWGLVANLPSGHPYKTKPPVK